MGYALADEFAKYMDHMLANCTTQAQLVSEVFVPSVNAMTIFMEKVFEDSISEYLAALVTSAKAREGLVIYVCCFLFFGNPFNCLCFFCTPVPS